MTTTNRERAREAREAKLEHIVHTATVVIVALILLLTFVGSTAAGTPRESRLEQIVATVAGRRVTVSCEANPVVWKREVETAQLAAASVAYYDPEQDVVRFGPLICSDLLTLRRGASFSSVRGMFIAAHEAAHARGIEDERIAHCWGVYWAQDLARRFEGVRFFTPSSRQVLAWAKQIHRDSPSEYRRACVHVP